MRSPSAPRPPGTFRFGRVGETDLLARPSLLVIGLVLVVLFAPRFSQQTEANPYVLAALFVLALYISVLIHELAHLAAARSYGMRVPMVTLHLLGGETNIEGESRTPGQEFITSIVGPLASLAIGLLAHAAAPDPDAVFGTLLWSIGWINLLVAAFNLLPGLPLDGGRVLRALVWWVTRSERTGIVVTAWVGRLAAIALVVAVGVRIAQGETWGRTWFVDAALVAFVVLFLWVGASSALRGADRAARIESLDARALAIATPESIDPAWPQLPHDARGVVLLRAMAAQPAQAYLLIDESGSPAGLLRAEAVDHAYRKES